MRFSSALRQKLLIYSCLIALLSSIRTECIAEVVTFESLAVPASGFYNGNTATTGPVRNDFSILGTRDNFGATEHLQEWTVDGVTFNNNYTNFGPFDSWTGWSWSSLQNPTTPGFTNQYAARPGQGADNSSNYLIAFGEAYFNVPINKQLSSVELTNTTYAARYIADGTDGFGSPDADPQARYGGPSGTDPDFFSVILSGYTGVAGNGSLIDEITVDLADYRFANSLDDFVITEWIQVGLESIKDARSVSLRFDTNDIGPFGPDTPLYVAMDNLKFVSSAPEPNSFVALAILTLCGTVSRRFRSCQGIR